MVWAGVVVDIQDMDMDIMVQDTGMMLPTWLLDMLVVGPAIQDMEDMVPFSNKDIRTDMGDVVVAREVVETAEAAVVEATNKLEANKADHPSKKIMSSFLLSAVPLFVHLIAHHQNVLFAF